VISFSIANDSRVFSFFFWSQLLLALLGTSVIFSARDKGNLVMVNQKEIRACLWGISRYGMNFLLCFMLSSSMITHCLLLSILAQASPLRSNKKACGQTQICMACSDTQFIPKLQRQ